MRNLMRKILSQQLHIGGINGETEVIWRSNARGNATFWRLQRNFSRRIWFWSAQEPRWLNLSASWQVKEVARSQRRHIRRFWIVVL